ncbi:MAG: outer membrane lipoprotein-sorting protein, partial [Proteobacteria bacterium]|nr:outer membrane lipoprotein-sorting protein [Pseudomonadota bacterium]
KAVQALAFKGKMGAGATTYEAVTEKRQLERKEREEMMLPFALESRRPNKTRLEITFNGQTAVQVYDGVNGYKYRPYLGREDWEPYSADELKRAAAEPGIDGLLIDLAARGGHVESAGTDTVEDKPAYRLKVTDKNGQVRHAWIDAASFLEVKEDGAPRKLDGKMHPVEVYLRDYKPEQGLMIPRVIETAVQGVPKTEKIVIDSVVVNPKLDDSRFQKAK